MTSKEDEKNGAGGGNDAPQVDMDDLSSLLSKFGLKTSEQESKPKSEKILDELTIEAVAKFMKTEKCKNIVVMVGAGISTSAGIPDFRSPGSGLYDNLQKYNLPTPQSIFEIGYFMERPEPFFKLAKELYPGSFKPTPCHYFIRLLAEKGKLLRVFSQNIDTLERIAGIPGDLIMEAHGTFHTGHCLGECKKEYTQEWMKTEIFKDKIPKCPECDGIVKPDIVFFGESLPARFHHLIKEDFPKADLLIVMGTSLKVQPFASLVDRVKDDTPRLLINLEKCGQVDPFMKMLGLGGGMDFDGEDNYRDVAEVNTCDEGCYKLAGLLGWKEELEEMVKNEHAKIGKEEDAAMKTNTAPKPSSPSKGVPLPKSTAASTGTKSLKTSSEKVNDGGGNKRVFGATNKIPSKTTSPSKGTSSLKASLGKVNGGAAKKTPSKSSTPRKGPNSLKTSSGKVNGGGDKSKVGAAKKPPSKSSIPSTGTGSLKSSSGKSSGGAAKKTPSKSSTPSNGTSSL